MTRRFTPTSLAEVAARRGQVVGRGDDRLAGADFAVEQLHQVLLRRDVDAGDGLVEQVELGLGGDRPGEERPPTLAAGQGARSGSARGPAIPTRSSAARDRIAIRAAGLAERTQPREATHHRDVPDLTGKDQSTSSACGHVGDATRRRWPAWHRGPRPCPSTARRRPAMSLSSVVLPPPFGPKIATSEPAAMSRSTSSSAGRPS